MNLRTYLSKERGRAAMLARLINAPKSDVSAWASRLKPKPVPPRRCVAIEQATGGVVTRKDLRPNDWHVYWPELVAL